MPKNRYKTIKKRHQLRKYKRKLKYAARHGSQKTSENFYKILNGMDEILEEMEKALQNDNENTREIEEAQKFDNKMKELEKQSVEKLKQAENYVLYALEWTRDSCLYISDFFKSYVLRKDLSITLSLGNRIKKKLSEVKKNCMNLIKEYPENNNVKKSGNKALSLINKVCDDIEDFREEYRKKQTRAKRNEITENYHAKANIIRKKYNIPDKDKKKFPWNKKNT